MKVICFLLLVVVSLATFSQQYQQFNVVTQNSINAPVQFIQTDFRNLDINNTNDDNVIEKQKQINFIDNNMSHINQLQHISNFNKQTIEEINSNGKGFEMSFNFSSHSTRSGSNKKLYKHTFHKKLMKFNRNFYGKMTLHKKSKHLVDVCFNWK